MYRVEGRKYSNLHIEQQKKRRLNCFEHLVCEGLKRAIQVCETDIRTNI